MSYSKLTMAALLAATVISHGADLFTDSFNRSDSTDLDATTTGMGGMLITNGTLSAGNVWLEPVDDGVPDPIKSAVTNNQVRLATEFGTSHAIVNHNLASEVPAGTLSVSLDVREINPGDESSPVNRYLGFGIGFTLAEGNINGDSIRSLCKVCNR